MINNISVIGAGTMGSGIAHAFALQGFNVSLLDNNPQVLELAQKTIASNLQRQVTKGTITQKQKEIALANIRVSSVLDSQVKVSELVIEAVLEDETAKLEVFRRLDEFCPSTTLLASNTSSISITKIASATRRPERVIGMHFMNPVPLMKLVEVIPGYATSAETTATITGLVQRIGKVAVISKDYPGFIANRILMPMINEAIYTLYEGVGSAEEIDQVMTLGMAHPMGPLQLADFIGLDVCLSILKVMHQGFGNPKYAPCPLLIAMVDAGKLGRKTREGFYRY